MGKKKQPHIVIEMDTLGEENEIDYPIDCYSCEEASFMDSSGNQRDCSSCPLWTKRKKEIFIHPTINVGKCA